MLDYYLKMVSQFIDDMRKQKLRCLLTMSGITWGTMAVILLLAFGEALRENALHSMSGMGSNIVILGGGRTSKSHNGIPPGRPIHIRPETADLMQAHIPAIGEISPEVDRWITLNIGKNRQNNNCVGVPPIYGTLRNIMPQKGGRFIDDLDMENRRRVIFLGNRIREKFFDADTDPIGKQIMLNDIPFTVIGIMEEKIQNSSYMTQDRNLVFIPFTTCMDIFGLKHVNRIIFRAEDTVDTPVIKEKVGMLLSKTLGFDPEDNDAIWMWDTSEGFQFIHYFFLGFEAFLFIGGLLTLVVGGIGVANIMYVTVRERRREIGIKAALGATPTLILGQFMLEAFIIMFIGGGIGVTGAWLVVTVFSSPAMANMQKYLGKPEIDLTISLIAVSILAVIGFAAGWSPAKRASDMEPVQALEF